MVEEKLAAYGVEAFPNDCVPPEYREQVYVFVAPHQTSFEGDNPHETAPTGKPKAISTHGLKPGWAGDHRFALFAGPGGSARQLGRRNRHPGRAPIGNVIRAANGWVWRCFCFLDHIQTSTFCLPLGLR